MRSRLGSVQPGSMLRLPSLHPTQTGPRRLTVHLDCSQNLKGYRSISTVAARSQRTAGATILSPGPKVGSLQGGEFMLDGGAAQESATFTLIKVTFKPC